MTGKIRAPPCDQTHHDHSVVLLFYNAQLQPIYSQMYSSDHVIEHTSKVTHPFPMVLVSSKGCRMKSGQQVHMHTALCCSSVLEQIWLQLNSTLLKWFVEHQFCFQTCETVLWLVLMMDLSRSLGSLETGYYSSFWAFTGNGADTMLCDAVC